MTETDTTTALVAAVPEEKRAAYELMLKGVKGEVDLVELQDSEEVARALALGLLGAETIEEVFGTQGLAPWSELLGRPVEVAEVHFNASTTEKGPGFYAVCRLVDLETGEQTTRHVGGYRPAAQLLWAWGHGALPLKCKLVEVGNARPGQSAPLGLELV